MITIHTHTSSISRSIRGPQNSTCPEDPGVSSGRQKLLLFRAIEATTASKAMAILVFGSHTLLYQCSWWEWWHTSLEQPYKVQSSSSEYMLMTEMATWLWWWLLNQNFTSNSSLACWKFSIEDLMAVEMNTQLDCLELSTYILPKGEKIRAVGIKTT